MSADEIWSVTDIQIKNKFNDNVNGISTELIKKYLTNYQLINHRSYGFFGDLKSELPENFKKIVDKYIRENNLSGRHLSAIWQKNK